MARHEIIIHHWHPARLNQLLSGHWGKRAKLKTADRKVIGAACFDIVPPAEGKRRVSLGIVLGPRQRAGDPDAYWKSLLDALVHCGALVNDSRQWCELGPVAFDRGPAKQTVVILEDLD